MDGAGNTIITLNGPSHIQWSDFKVTAGRTLTFQSTNNGQFATLNTVGGLFARPSNIAGGITADGPFRLVNAGGITLAATGSISAPSVFLSTLTPADPTALLAGQSTTFSKTGFGLLTLSGVVTATQGSLIAASPILTVNQTATLAAPAGRVQLVAGESGISGPNSTGHLASVPGAMGTITTNGAIRAREVELIAHSFITNGGTLESCTPGMCLPGNFVRLTASHITHETKGIISTSQLTTTGVFEQKGRIIRPNDGANPGTVSSTLQVPTFTTAATKPAQASTDIRPGLLSYTHLQNREPAVQPRGFATGTEVATRSGVALKKKSKSVVARSSFFGTVR